MPNLQELITRGRLLLSGAPKRLEVFEMINGNLSAKEIARKLGRSHSSVLKDIAKFRDFELIGAKKGKTGEDVKKLGSLVFEKSQLVKHIPNSYFGDVSNTSLLSKEHNVTKKVRYKASTKVHVPNENEILDICNDGESQLYEFKSPGASTEKITKEIAAFLHTRSGGIVFYGVEDDGSIIGSDLKRQQFDQRLQNSIRNTILPPPNVEIVTRKVLGSEILLVIIPPWVRRRIYQYSPDNRYYIRKGTNVFALKPDEIQRLSNGEFIV